MSDETHLARWEGESMRYWTQVWDLPELHFLPRTASTNDDAMRLAEHGAPAGTTVLTDEQTAGKGRLGRRWDAPPGKALLCSVVLRPLPPERVIRIPGVVPIRIGVAVARAIHTVTRVPAGIKWPNDIVVQGEGKVAGILCESAFTDGAAEYVVAGIGINVNQQPDELPDDARQHATSLAIATGNAVSRADVAGAVFREIARIAPFVGDLLDARDLGEFRRLDVLFGAHILVDGNHSGIASGIEPDGAMIIAGNHGSHAVRGGTVRFAGEPDPDLAYPIGPPATDTADEEP